MDAPYSIGAGAQERIMESLEELFEEVRTQANVPATDMPDVEVG